MPLAAIPHEPVRATSPRSPMPAAARRLRLPLHHRAEERTVARWGFSLDAADATERARALVTEQPADADRHVLLAAALARRGDQPAALAAARQAVTLAPSSARAHTTLATVLAQAHDSVAALEHAAIAAELDPTDPAARYNRGLLLAAGDRTGAQRDFDAVAELLGMPPPPRWRRWLHG